LKCTFNTIRKGILLNTLNILKNILKPKYQTISEYELEYFKLQIIERFNIGILYDIVATRLNNDNKSIDKYKAIGKY